MVLVEPNKNIIIPGESLIELFILRHYEKEQLQEVFKFKIYSKHYSLFADVPMFQGFFPRIKNYAMQV